MTHPTGRRADAADYAHVWDVVGCARERGAVSTWPPSAKRAPGMAARQASGLIRSLPDPHGTRSRPGLDGQPDRRPHGGGPDQLRALTDRAGGAGNRRDPTCARATWSASGRSAASRPDRACRPPGRGSRSLPRAGRTADLSAEHRVPFYGETTVSLAAPDRDPPRRVRRPRARLGPVGEATVAHRRRPAVLVIGALTALLPRYLNREAARRRRGSPTTYAYRSSGGAQVRLPRGGRATRPSSSQARVARWTAGSPPTRWPSSWWPMADRLRRRPVLLGRMTAWGRAAMASVRAEASARVEPVARAACGHRRATSGTPARLAISPWSEVRILTELILKGDPRVQTVPTHRDGQSS